MYVHIFSFACYHNFLLFILPLQFKNKPHDEVQRRAFILELGVATNTKYTRSDQDKIDKIFTCKYLCNYVDTWKESSSFG
jgi:hypothetical protein